MAELNKTEKYGGKRHENTDLKGEGTTNLKAGKMGDYEDERKDEGRDGVEKLSEFPEFRKLLEIIYT